jgi:hypothetical protein
VVLCCWLAAFDACSAADMQLAGRQGSGQACCFELSIVTGACQDSRFGLLGLGRAGFCGSSNVGGYRHDKIQPCGAWSFTQVDMLASYIGAAGSVCTATSAHPAQGAAANMTVA